MKRQIEGYFPITTWVESVSRAGRAGTLTSPCLAATPGSSPRPSGRRRQTARSVSPPPVSSATVNTRNRCSRLRLPNTSAPFVHSPVTKPVISTFYCLRPTFLSANTYNSRRLLYTLLVLPTFSVRITIHDPPIECHRDGVATSTLKIIKHTAAHKIVNKCNHTKSFDTVLHTEPTAHTSSSCRVCDSLTGVGKTRGVNDTAILPASLKGWSPAWKMPTFFSVDERATAMWQKWADNSMSMTCITGQRSLNKMSSKIAAQNVLVSGDVP